MKKPYWLLLLLIFTTNLSFGQLATEKLILGQWDLVKIKVQYDDCYGFYLHELNPCDTLFFEVDSSVKKMRIKFYEKYAIMSYGQKMQRCTFDFNDTIVDPYFRDLGEVENDFYYNIELYRTFYYLKLGLKKNKPNLQYKINHIDNYNLIISTINSDYGFDTKNTYFYVKTNLKKDSTKLNENDLYAKWFNYNGTKNDHCKEFHLDTFLITNKNKLPSNTYFGCCLNFQFEHKFQPNEYNNIEISTLVKEVTENEDGFIGVGTGDYYNWKLDYENQILYFYKINYTDNHERIETITLKLKLNYLGDGVLQCIRLPLD